MAKDRRARAGIELVAASDRRGIEPSTGRARDLRSILGRGRLEGIDL